jgi:uncharacterized lipoprotein YmbA
MITALTVIAVGCLPKPQADQTRVFVLTPLPGSGHSSGRVPALQIGLGPVNLPEYLDQTNLATRIANNEIRVEENSRWGEPLRDALGRTLGRDLEQRLSGTRIVAYPWDVARRPDLAVEVNVLRFERNTQGYTEIVARWSIRDAAGGPLLDGRELRLTRPTSSLDDGAAVAALSRGLADLSDAIAADVRTAARAAPSVRATGSSGARRSAQSPASATTWPRFMPTLESDRRNRGELRQGLPPGGRGPTW